MSTEYYSTPEDVIKATGIKYDDFINLETTVELTTMIEGWLKEIKSIIDYDRNRDYSAETEVPLGIHNIARRACVNMVFYAIQAQRSPVIKVGDWSIKMIEERVFTISILRDLHKFPAKMSFRWFPVIEDTYSEEEGS